uniref:CCHC-type domain-containing protein n=1 Tax=Tanacetum cinerariifolium TaxID=118510 RepID=A0A6L2NN20_TANCI|nr:hypothetical protein [Tanacetum cinerariifolium]
MSTPQDIYAAGSEIHPPMLNKENYVPWSSCLLCYAKSRPNGKLIHNSIINGPCVRRMILELCDTNRDVPEKKAKLFNEWERFTFNEGESIESYYHRFLKLMNDLKRNKHFLENIDECPKNIGSDVVKNLKKPSQAPRGVPIGPNVRFKLVKQVYKPKMNNVNTSGNKKKDVESTKESKRLIIDGKVTLVDDKGKPLEKIDSLSNYDSKDEVASVDNEMASFLASKKVGYGTNSLLEQWKETYEKAEYYYDPYDDDLYEGQEDPDNIQSICDKIDIKIRGQAKVIKCYNCQAEEHMAKQCTQPKIRRDATWFKEKVLHVQAQAEDTLILAEESRLKMVEKQNDPIMKIEKINIALINYFELNKLAKNFGKHFVPQQELLAKQKFWLQSFDKNSKEPSTSNTPVKIEVPSELPKLQVKDTVISKLKETIHSLRENVNLAKVKTDIVEIETINIELEHNVAKLLSENKKLHKEREHLKKTYKELYDSIKPSRVHAKEQCDSLIANLNSKSIENADLKTQIQEKVVQIILWYLDSGCSKHMTENHSQLTNFVNKFLVTVKFSNDHIAKIMGYGNYQIRNVTISRVYYVEGLRHNLFSVSQFYVSDLEVAFYKHTCIVHNLKEASKTKSWLWHRRLSHLNFGTINQLAKQGLVREFIDQTLRSYYEDVGISHETSMAHTPQQNDVVERRNCTLVEAARTIKPDLSYLYVFAALCYPTNDSEDLGKLKAKADVGIFIGYAPTKKAYRIYNRRLMPQPLSLTPFVPPTRDDWNTLLQPLFDEYFCPPPCVDHPVLEVAAPVSVVSTGSPSSTSVDQDASSPSTYQTPQESPSYVIPLDAKEASTSQTPHMDNNP